MTNKTILVDMDGVVADWVQGVYELCSMAAPELDFSALLSQTEWEMRDVLDPLALAVYDRVKTDPRLYSILMPYEGVIDAVFEMESAGHTVFFCSTPSSDNLLSASAKYSWIGETYGLDFREKTILTHDKTAVRGDYLFDDKPSIHGKFTPEWVQVVVDRPYNTTSVSPLRVSSLADWKEIINA